MRFGGWLWRHRLGPPVLALLLLGLAPGAVSADPQASVYSNVTTFDGPCDGTPDTISETIRVVARTGFQERRYETVSYEGTGFTRTKVFSRVAADEGFYVHSHGDWYLPSDNAAFMTDAAVCSGPKLWSHEIQSRRGHGGQLVIMSTCHLAEVPPSGKLGMYSAFGIERVKSKPDGTGYRGREFFLGYHGDAWTYEQLSFERIFWAELDKGRNLGQAFDIARANAHLSYGTRPDWFGSYTYTGWGPTSTPCPTCQ
jgi:hypothetical protein